MFERETVVTSSSSGVSWRPVAWPGQFIFLDEDRPASDGTKEYLLFRGFRSPRSIHAYLLSASDVELQIALNGSIVKTFNAAPQRSQTRHDEFILNRTQLVPVPVYKGDNYLEVAVRQPPGTKGFLVGFVSSKGKPLALKLSDDSPPGEDDVDDEIVSLRHRDPVYNGSFETGGDPPTAWVRGANEGDLRVAIEGRTAAKGSRSVRLELRGAGRGGLIQRLVVEPNTEYRLTAALRAQRLQGEAYVSLFRGDIHNKLVNTNPITKGTVGWDRLDLTWVSRKTRTVYVACYVKGTRGTVWFDEVHMSKKR